MRRSITVLAPAAVAVAVAALAAGCGGSSETSASGSSTGTSSGGYASGGNSSAGTTQAAAGATVAVADSSLGPILVDGQGRTLYLFEKDTGTASTCTAACASFWPPDETSGAPTPGSGAVAADLGTSKRSDGTLQVTYNGHPLYTYEGDSKAGETNGEGIDEFGAEWYAVSPAGQTVENGSS
jgi:predicted lipoprotein with Yx(FWY)xxD motif